jgi:hypothetical protein
MKTDNVVQVDPRREYRRPKLWHDLGAAVHDAFSLLESVSGSFEGEPDSQEGREMQYATKVAAHALRPVLDELNTVERECSYITIPSVPDQLGR